MDLAAGKRHTLFVSDDGLVFSVGEGLCWQLGTTSEFTNHPERQAIQRLPKQVKRKPDHEIKERKAKVCLFSLRLSVRRKLNSASTCRTSVEFVYFPAQVHPSGHLKAGKDYWVAQAAAGDTFSVTREANWEDAARATEGFLWMKEVTPSTPLEQQQSTTRGCRSPRAVSS